MAFFSVPETNIVQLVVVLSKVALVTRTPKSLESVRALLTFGRGQKSNKAALEHVGRLVKQTASKIRQDIGYRRRHVLKVRGARKRIGVTGARNGRPAEGLSLCGVQASAL